MDALLYALETAHPKPENKPTTLSEEDIAGLEENFRKLLDEVCNLRETIERQGLAIGVIARDMEAECPFFTEILNAVCEFYNVTRRDIASARRTMNLVRPRQIACYLGRKLTLLSFPEMGRLLGKRDHTTILHASRKIERLIERDEILRDDIDVLTLKISERVLARKLTGRVA